MKKNLISIAVATTLGLAAFTAGAEDMYRGAWYAVPGVSYMDTDGDLEADNGAGGFIRLGKELSEHWDIQIGAGHARADEDTGIPGVGGKYKQTLVGVDALYMFSRDKFRPFVLAGAGVARNELDYTNIDLGDDSKNSPFVNVGLGAQYLFTDNFGLQADVRHVWSKAEGKTASRSVDADETIGNTYVNLGAIFRFGAPEAVPVAESAPEPAPIAAAEPAPAPEPAPVAEACKPQFETVTVSAEKLFGFDKVKLREDGKTELIDAAAKLKANPDIQLVMVTGHTDRLGTDAYNQKLSERRANQVRDYLISQGVEANRLQAVGKGESEPVVACDDVKGRKKLI
jgi:OOP family OmpA-OmpF porin